MSTATRLFVLLVQPLLVQPLLLPALARTSRQLGARPVGAPALRLAPRSRLVVGLADDDNINGYRELGLAEDATYDEVMDAFMSLSETYSDNPERMMVSPAAPYRSTPRLQAVQPSPASPRADARAGQEQGAGRAAEAADVGQPRWGRGLSLGRASRGAPPARPPGELLLRPPRLHAAAARRCARRRGCTPRSTRRGRSVSSTSRRRRTPCRAFRCLAP